MKKWISQYFGFDENGTNFRREISGGVVTFLTMSYIIFLQPSVLQQAGMDFGSVMMATCLASALATLVMGIYANYPIALAPGMGENFFFAFTVVIMLKVPWQQALGIVFISGVICVILSALKVRDLFINAIPDSLKYAIVTGIGLFIGFIGLADAGIIIRNNSPLKAIAFQSNLSSSTIIEKLDTFQYATGAVKIGDLTNPAAIVAMLGLFIIAFLMIKRVKGAILWGILITSIIALFMHVISWHGIIDTPPSIKPTIFQLSFKGIFTFDMLPIVIVFFIMDFFDTVGTLIGVATRANLLKDNKLPRAARAFIADSLGTVFGSLLGTSTTTSYIESTAGVEEGSRTGFSSVITGLLFLAAMFFYPLMKMLGGGYTYSAVDNLYLYPITASVLIIVGTLMIREIGKINWSDYEEAIPAFMIVVGIPLTYSIADGIAFGFISYTVLKLFSGKFKELNIIILIVSVIFILRFVFFRF